MTSSKHSKKPNVSSSKTSIKSLINASISELRRAGVDSPRTDVLALLEYQLERSKTWILSHQDEPVNDSDLIEYNSMLSRRMNREPLAYILGKRDFYGLEFKVNPSVLIPRPETEALVEHVLDLAAPNSSLLDIGTGSGAIAISIASNRQDLIITASDVSAEALEIAEYNSSNNFTNINFIHSDLFYYITNSYDIIAANLPYVSNKIELAPEIGYEPHDALYANSDGVAIYQKFFNELATYLNIDGWFIIEHDPTQAKEIQRIATKGGFSTEVVSKFVSKGRLKN